MSAHFPCIRNIEAEQGEEGRQRFEQLVAQGVMQPRYKRETLEPHATIAYHLDAFGLPVIHLGCEPQVKQVYSQDKDKMQDVTVIGVAVRFITRKELEARKLTYLPSVPVGEDWVIVYQDLHKEYL
jgi:hypothetical protein